MNISDSERIAAVLESLGYKKVIKESRADLLIINMCSVRQSAVDRVYGRINNYHLSSWRSVPFAVSIDQSKQLKNNLTQARQISNSYSKRCGAIESRNKPKTILTGCILPEDRKKLENKVDLILEIKNLTQLPEILNQIKKKQTSKAYYGTPKHHSKNYLKISPKHSSSALAHVPISTGCNNFCSYCVVPYTRGKETYRPAEEIISEVKNLVKKGYKEICLLGQNVNSYRSNVKCQISNVKTTTQSSKLINFSILLKLINSIPGNFQLAFLTSHPKDMSDELIETIAKGDKIKKELHLPVQSGDNEILRKMNRGYTVKDYENLISKVRSKINEIYLSTDIIVGFPSETKKQFENTIKLCKKIKFDKVYVAQYSPRLGTVACQMTDGVPKEEKKRRWKILDEMINNF